MCIGSQFIKFGVVGLLNTFVHYLIFFLLFRIAGVEMITASALGYLLGVLNSFVLNRRWTFEVTGDGHRKDFVKFFSVNLISLAVNLLCLRMLVSSLQIWPELAQVIAIGCALLINFAGNRWWTFKRNLL
jgi:putative flippase GtrA